MSRPETNLGAAILAGVDKDDLIEGHRRQFLEQPFMVGVGEGGAELIGGDLRQSWSNNSGWSW